MYDPASKPAIFMRLKRVRMGLTVLFRRLSSHEVSLGESELALRTLGRSDGQSVDTGL